MTAGLAARDITTALRSLYPRDPITTTTTGGAFTVTMPASVARYWVRDPAYGAAWLSRRLRSAVEITAVGPVRAATSGPLAAAVTVQPVPGGLLPPDPGSTLGIPLYAAVREVLGDFPATRTVRAMVQVALGAGLRSHTDLAPSPHGRRYRVMLWGTGPRPLCGCIDVYEQSGRYAAAWLTWGTGPEAHYDQGQLAAVRAQLATAKAQRKRAATMLRAGR